MAEQEMTISVPGEIERLRQRVAALERQLAACGDKGDCGSEAARLRLVLEQMPVIVWATDTELRLTTSIGAGLKRIGLVPGSTDGSPLQNMLRQGMRGDAITATRRALAGESVAYDGRFKEWFIKSQMEPLRDDSGAIVGCVGVAYDVTEHHEAEEKLRDANAELEERVAEREVRLAQSEAIFRVTLEQMPDLFVVHEIQGPPDHHRILLTNAATADALGYTVDELVWMSVEELQDPAAEGQRAARLARAMAGETVVYECHVRRRDGSLFPAEVRSRVFQYAGRPVLMAIARDLTPRKEAERQLRLVQSAVNQVTDAVTITGPDFDEPGPRIIYVNPAFEKMTGYTAAEVIGQTPRLLQGPKTSRAVLDRLRESLRKGRPFHGETYNYRKDGTEFVVEWRIAPIRAEGGEITHWVAIQRDMTQARRDAELAEQHRSELAHVSRLSTMGEMASGLAHELNQPLTAITNYAQGCLRRMDGGGISEPELREAVERMAGQAQRAGQVIQRLRQFVRKHEPRRSTTDLNQLVRDAAMLLEQDAHQHRVSFRFDFDESMPSVLCDAIQVEQVILNLMRNAIEAMAAVPAGERVVHAATRHDAGSFTLTVRDAGPGIDEASLHQIFDPFFTTKPRGMGMGLTISRTIIEAHGGTLSAARNDDRGMNFTLSLPLPRRRR